MRIRQLLLDFDPKRHAVDAGRAAFNFFSDFQASVTVRPRVRQEARLHWAEQEDGRVD